MNPGILTPPTQFATMPRGLLGRAAPFQMPESSGFRGGDVSVASIYEAATAMATGASTPPASGGRLTINGESFGSYDYAVQPGQTISSFTAADWFTNAADTRSAWCVVRGDLTINAGVAFTPPVRKLFSVLVITGNLTLNGAISMTARGANHSGTGNSAGATAARSIRIINGTYSGVVDPSVPAIGGSGGANTTSTTAGNAGGAGTNGGCGGGASGAFNSGFAAGTNGGSPGTSFSGGSGGGSKAGANFATPGSPNGGAGGSATGSNSNAGGGAGNPGGIATGADSVSGSSGTGGVLIVIVLGTLRGTGAVSANGSSGGLSTVPGGGSGGGSVTVICGSDSSSVIPTATGGAGGGGGGAGTARKLRLVAPSVHAEALDWSLRVAANGGYVNDATLVAVSEFCNSIDAAGIRDRFLRLNLFCGTSNASLSAVRTPLYRGQSLTGTQYGAATDSITNFVAADYNETGASGGLKGNGSTKHMETGLLHSTLNSFFPNIHLSCYLTQASSIAYADFLNQGDGSGGWNYLLCAKRDANNYHGLRSRVFTGDFITDGASLIGHRVLTVTNATTHALYRNGTITGSGPIGTQAPTAYSGVGMSIFASRIQTSPAGQHSDVRAGAYSFGLEMTASQVAAYNTAIKAFQTALGRP